jgi:putative ABC transport system permease protein
MHTIDGLDADSFQQLVILSMASGSADTLKQGQVLVDTDLAASDHLTIGATVSVDYPDRTSGRLTVGGVFRSNQLLSHLLLANSGIASHDAHPFIGKVLVKGANGPSQDLRQAVTDAAGRNPAIDVRDKQEMAEQDNQKVNSAMSLLDVLLGMSVLVAVLGVVNTMAMSVFERRREIGLLRALGLDRSGVRVAVRLESAVVSLFGATLGLVLGSYLAWAAVSTLTVELPGITTVLPYGRLLLFLLAAGAVGLLAAVWPARQAARVGILESIA